MGSITELLKSWLKPIKINRNSLINFQMFCIGPLKDICSIGWTDMRPNLDKIHLPSNSIGEKKENFLELPPLFDVYLRVQLHSLFPIFNPNPIAFLLLT